MVLIAPEYFPKLAPEQVGLLEWNGKSLTIKLGTNVVLLRANFFFVNPKYGAAKCMDCVLNFQIRI